jgi:hypothetical protein
MFGDDGATFYDFTVLCVVQYHLRCGLRRDRGSLASNAGLAGGTRPVSTPLDRNGKRFDISMLRDGSGNTGASILRWKLMNASVNGTPVQSKRVVSAPVSPFAPSPSRRLWQHLSAPVTSSAASRSLTDAVKRRFGPDATVVLATATSLLRSSLGDIRPITTPSPENPAPLAYWCVLMDAYDDRVIMRTCGRLGMSFYAWKTRVARLVRNRAVVWRCCILLSISDVVGSPYSTTLIRRLRCVNASLLRWR